MKFRLISRASIAATAVKYTRSKNERRQSLIQGPSHGVDQACCSRGDLPSSPCFLPERWWRTSSRSNLYRPVILGDQAIVASDPTPWVQGCYTGDRWGMCTRAGGVKIQAQAGAFCCTALLHPGRRQFHGLGSSLGIFHAKYYIPFKNFLIVS